MSEFKKTHPELRAALRHLRTSADPLSPPDWFFEILLEAEPYLPMPDAGPKVPSRQPSGAFAFTGDTPLNFVLLSFPDGLKVMPIFTDEETMLRAVGKATHFVQLEVPTICQMAVRHRDTPVLVINYGDPEGGFAVGHQAIEAMANKRLPSDWAKFLAQEQSHNAR